MDSARSQTRIGYSFRWSPDSIALVGTDSDVNVASTLGIPTETVYRMRLFLGGGKAHLKRKPPIIWHRGILDSLGRMSDRKVAKQFGLSPRDVSHKRQLLGIPPCPRGSAKVHVQWT